MDQRPAPEAIFELIHCNCIKSKFITNQCSRRANSLACTDVCNCNDCENEFNLQVQVSAEDELNDSDIKRISKNNNLCGKLSINPETWCLLNLTNQPFLMF